MLKYFERGSSVMWKSQVMIPLMVGKALIYQELTGPGTIGDNESARTQVLLQSF